MNYRHLLALSVAVATVIVIEGMGLRISSAQPLSLDDHEAAWQALTWEMDTTDKRGDLPSRSEIITIAAHGDVATARKRFDLLATPTNISNIISYGTVEYPRNDRIPKLIAELILATRAVGLDPHSVAGFNLIDELEKLIISEGEYAGFAVPSGSRFPSLNPDLIDTKTQALAVFALSSVGKPPATAVKRLTDYQCEDGSFVGDYFNNDNELGHSCDDSWLANYVNDECTAWVVISLQAARAAGAPDLDIPIKRAEDLLRVRQQKSGGWFAFTERSGADLQIPEAETIPSGLAVSALSASCTDPAALMRARDFIRSLQADTVDDANTALHDQIGVITSSSKNLLVARDEGLKEFDLIDSSLYGSLAFIRVPLWDVVAPSESMKLRPGGCNVAPVVTPTPAPSLAPTPTAAPTAKPSAPSDEAEVQPTVTTTAHVTVTAPPLPRVVTGGPADAGRIVVTAPGAVTPAARNQAKTSAVATSSASTSGTVEHAGGVVLLPRSALAAEAESEVTGQRSWWRGGWGVCLVLVAGTAVGFGAPSLTRRAPKEKD